MPSTIAIVPSTDYFEQHFGAGLGLSKDEYAASFKNDWLFSYAAMFITNGHKVSIVMPSIGSRISDRRPSALHGCDIIFTPVAKVLRKPPVSIRRSAVMRDAWSFVYTGRNLLKVLYEFDIVICQEYTTARFRRLVRRLSTKARRTVLIGSHHGGELTRYSGWKLKRARLDGVGLTALTPIVANELSAVIRNGRAEVRSIPNFVEVDVFGAANPDLRGTGLVWVGRLNDRQKNLSAVLEAIASMDRAVWAPLRVVGDGPDGEMLRRKAAELGLVGSVRWYGFVTDREVLAGLYRQASAFVSLSHYEGLPLSVLEAAACGLPCVLSDIDGHRYAGGGEEWVELVGNPVEGVAEALGRVLLRGEAERVALQKMARSRVLSHFTAAAVLSSYEELFRSVKAARRA